MDPILKSRFLSLYCMILADGVIDASELEMLYKIGTENYNLTVAEITQTVRDAGSSFVVPKKLSDKITLLYELTQIAWADGTIDPAEIELLKKYTLKMGFDDNNVDDIVTLLIDSVKNGVPVQTILSMQ
ncbi:MAG: TerB family tellurite resistance protein [Muribaculaceae bacterium]|nr:TerB family tellurite resistance protein [Bacteroides sp.]MDE7472945.1 TerB family tellurite resistance protein [Muribaculaceae bacterium]